MRPEVVGRANEALARARRESREGRAVASPDIVVEARFDEFNLDLDVSWDGDLVEVSDVLPSVESLRMKRDAFLRLSGFLIRHYSDRVTAERRGDRCRVLLHFEH